MRRWAGWILAVGAAGSAVALWATEPGPGHTPQPAIPGPSPERVIHYVTPAQLAAAGSTSQPVNAVTGTDHAGRAFAWPDPAGDRPLALVFLKAGCPCSDEFEPFFHRLHAAYGEAVRFAGVIDADVSAARKFAEANRTPYPILADPSCELVRRFRAENGGYLALIAPSGTIDLLSPGCSADLFRALGRRLAILGGTAEQPLDLAGLPDAPVTGCPFDLR